MAQTDRDVFDKVGQYNLDEIAIISYRFAEDSLPRRIDIRGILYNFEIAEDILLNNIVGSAIVYDMQDIRSILPIIGLERLSLKFNSPGTSGYDYSEDTGVPLQIYKIDKVRKDPQNERAQLYQIFFCSPEMYHNNTTRISRAYAGPVEDAVLDIVRNKLKSKKPFYFEPTSTNAKYVIPNLKPYQAINFLCSQAKSKKFRLNAGYKFFETSEAFHFRSLESMMGIDGQLTETQPKWKFMSMITSITEDQKRPEIKDLERRLSTVIKYEFDKPVDTLDNIQNGFYANKVTTHDAFNKTIKTTTYDYNEIGPNQAHTEMAGSIFEDAGLLYPQDGKGKGVKFADTNKSLTELSEAKTMVVTETSKVHNDYEFTPSSELLPMMTHQKQAMRNMNLSLLVYGNTILNAGDIITFSSPVQRPGDTVEMNPYTSGRYVIMAIKHMVNVESQRHEMILKCFKDAVSTPYPTEEDALNQIGKGNTVDGDIYKIQRASEILS